MLSWIPLPGQNARKQRQATARAKDLLSEAATIEKVGDLEHALSLYERGAALLQDAIKGEKDVERKAELRELAQGALEKAEHIQAHVACQAMTLSCQPPTSLQEAAACLRASPRLAGIAILLAMIFAMWFVYLTDILLLGCNGFGTPGSGFCGYRFYFSTAPRMGNGPTGMWVRSFVLGVPFQWLCHSSFNHIWSNTVFFFIFGSIIVLRSAVGDPVRTLLGALACSALAPGLTSWLGLFGWPAGCGASGVVFGLFGYCVAFGVFRLLGVPPLPTCSSDCGAGGGALAVCRCFCSWVMEWLDSKNWLCTFGALLDITLSVVLGVAYSYLFAQATPGGVGPGVGWQGHLSGFIGGVCWAAANAERARRRDEAQLENDARDGPGDTSA